MLHRTIFFYVIVFILAAACPLGAFGEETVPVPGTVVTAPAAVVTTPIEVARPLLKRETLNGDYELAWSDEFNSDKLDTAVWDYRNETKFWSTGTDKNVSVSGGYLHIALKKEKTGKSDYSAGGIVAKRLFRYGYYEISAKLPPGKGWHTSIFLTAHRAEITGSRQQIDLCENDSIDPKLFFVNLHTWKPMHRIFDSKRVKGPDLSQDFHVFGCEFTPQKVRYFQDGELVATFDADKMVHDDQSVYITCYAAPLGKTFHVDDEKLPTELAVDWVRFYEKKK